MLYLLVRAAVLGASAVERLLDLLRGDGGEVTAAGRGMARLLRMCKIPVRHHRLLRLRFHSLPAFSPPLPSFCDYVDVVLPGSALRALWINPRREAASKSAGSPDGSGGSRGRDRVILYLHGGGLISNRPRSYAFFLAHLSRAAGARVFAVDYRWAPEHRWPAQLDDAERAYEHLVDPAGAAVAPADILFAGDSAGAGLAAHLLVLLRDKGVPLPAGAALLSPWIDFRCEGDTWSAEMNRRDPMIDAEDLRRVGNRTLMGRPPLPEDMPAVSRPLHGLPPCLVMVGSEECLLGDSDSFTARARHAGVQVELQVWRGMFHVFPVLVPFLPEAWRGLAILAAFLAHAPRDPAHRSRPRL
eukprot:tig00000655_g2844.t1